MFSSITSTWITTLTNLLTSSPTFIEEYITDKSNITISVQREKNSIKQEADFGYVPLLKEEKERIYSSCKWNITNNNISPISIGILFLPATTSSQYTYYLDSLPDNTNNITTIQIEGNSSYSFDQYCYQSKINGMNIEYLVFILPSFLDSYYSKKDNYSSLIIRRSLSINVDKENMKLLSVESTPYYPLSLRLSLFQTPEIIFQAENPFPTQEDNNNNNNNYYIQERTTIPSYLLDLNIQKVLYGDSEQFDKAWELFTQEEMKKRKLIKNINQDLKEFNLFCEKFRLALFAEELELINEMYKYDLFYVLFLPSFSQEKGFFCFKVPGVAEQKPNLQLGDLIYVWILGKKGKEIEKNFSIQCECYITYIIQDQVTINFPLQQVLYYFGLNSAKELLKQVDFHIRFTLNNYKFKCFQNALVAINSFSSIYKPLLFPSSSSSFLSPSSQDSKIKLYNPVLNSEQKLAVQDIINQSITPSSSNNNNNIYIIHGPPGTGKTITVVESILQTLIYHKGKCRILVCAPSGYSADVLTNKLSEYKEMISPKNLLRLNSFQRHISILPHLSPFCLKDETTGLYRIPSLIEIVQYSIIICTCLSSQVLVDLKISKGYFSSIFVDEAGQALEPELYIPLQLADSHTQIIMAGDPMQLSPIVHSPLAQELGLECSLQERIMNLYRNNNKNNMVSLLNNYRAHPALLQVTSDLFYDSTLKCCADLTKVNSLAEWNNNFPLLFQGCIGKDVYVEEQNSFYNQQDIFLISELIEQLLEGKKVLPGEITVIAPYRLQVMKIRHFLRKKNLSEIQVEDVEAMQGREQRIIIISTTLSRSKELYVQKIKKKNNNKKELNLLNNPKRFNVALSRAKALTIIVGNPYFLQHEFYWSSLMEYCIRNQSYTGCDIPIQLQYNADSATTLGNGYTINNSEKLVDKEIEENCFLTENLKWKLIL